MSEAKKDNVVKVHYTGKLDNGQVFDSSKDREELKPEIGMELVSKSPDGQEQIVKIAEVKEASIVVDANHPLAGQDLTFEIELVDIQ